MGRKRIHENRQKAYKDSVISKGGSRRTFLLSPEATAGLKVWRDCVGAKSDREAVELAILKSVRK
jgi:hypothetical protein